MGWLCLSFYVCYICGCMCSSNCDFLQVPQHLSTSDWGWPFLSVFAKLRKMTLSFMPVSASTWNNSPPIYKISSLSIFWVSVEKIYVALQSDKNNDCFTCKPTHIFYHILLTPSQNEKCFRLKSLRKSEHTFYVQWHL